MYIELEVFGSSGSIVYNIIGSLKQIRKAETYGQSR